MSKIQCRICPHLCVLEEGQKGFCSARSNHDGVIRDDNYGMITAIALDPIEKKPLYHFFPGSKILSVGSFGCNLRCSFCQNHEISMAEIQRKGTVYISPKDLIKKAQELIPKGNIGIAYTYNEPLIGYEYVRDGAIFAKKNGLKTVLVTNGYINKEPLLELLPVVDAMNVDLKSFSEDFYKKIAGNIEPVKQSIELAAQQCHVEVTTLIIPKENDSPDEMRELSGWIASINNKIPLHISRFFPRYHMIDRASTPVDTVYSLADIAREKLLYVYEGNC
ncbi:MAG: AmmeMemoRadiSam system radical SAM enzyme [Christensenellales bacterium]|jgi:pyruvate formate lyase activating enzyme